MSLVVGLHILNSQLNNFCLNLCFFLIAAELLDDLLDQPRVTDESRDDADDEDDDADDADEEEEGMVAGKRDVSYIQSYQRKSIT